MGECSYHGNSVRREFNAHVWKAGLDVFGVRQFDLATEMCRLLAEFYNICEDSGPRWQKTELEVPRRSVEAREEPR
eukprot:11157025-Lingulodinium_polyedra.AAC.1